MKKGLRYIIVIGFIFILMINSAGLMGIPRPDTSVVHADELSPSMGEDPSQTIPSFCKTNTPAIGVRVWEIETNSTVFPDTNGPYTNAPGLPDPPQIKVVSGDTVTITVRADNRAGITMNDFDGAVEFAGGRILPVIWTGKWVGRTTTPRPATPSAFDGTLAPDEVAEGYVEFVAQPSDPYFISFEFLAWTPGNPVESCDGEPSSQAGFSFIIDGPSVSATLSATPFAANDELITYDLTIENLRDLATTISNITDLVYAGNPAGCAPANTPLINQLSTTILADSTSSVTLSFQCPMLASYPDTVTNTITIDATSGTPPNDITRQVIVSASTERKVAEISVFKYAQQDIADIGDTITYDIRVENSGSSILNNITVVDTLTGIVSDVPQTMLPGEFYETTIDYVVRETDADPLINILTAVAVSDFGTTVGDNFTETVDKRNPAIQLTMAVDPAAGGIGDTVQYNFTIENTSDTELLSVLLEFPLCGTPNPPFGNFVNVATSLPVGGITSGSCNYTITGSEIEPFGYSTETTATATATTALGASVSDEASAYLDILAQDFRVVVDTDPADMESALRGAFITYVIRLENLNPAAPVTITSIDSNLLGDLEGYMGVGYSLPITLEPQGLANATFEFTAEYSVGGSDPDPLVHVVSAQDDDSNQDTTSHVLDISDAQMFISVITTKPEGSPPVQVQTDSAYPSEVVTYDVFISNNGRITLTDITAQYTIPGTAITGGINNLSFPGASGILAPFELATGNFQHTVSSSDPDPLIVEVIVYATDDYGQVREFRGTAIIDVLPTELQLSKTSSVVRGAVGDVITYEFVVENITATDTITDIVLIDELCPDADPEATAAGCRVGDEIVLYDLPPDDPTRTALATPVSLAAGEFAYGELLYTVVDNDLARENAEIFNVASVSGDLAGMPVGDASSYILSVINPLQVQKLSTALAIVGECIQYQFIISNSGQINDLTNIFLNDPQVGLAVNIPGTIPPGGSVYFPSQAVIDANALDPVCGGLSNPGEHEVTDSDLPQITNIVTVDALSNGEPVTNTAVWTVQISPPIVVSKIGPGFAVMGDTVRYIVNVTNVADINYTLVRAEDNPNVASAPGLTWNAAQLDAVSDNPGDTTLVPGESLTLEWDYVLNVDEAVRDSHSLSNIFAIFVVPQGGGAEEAYADDHTIEVYSPFLIFKLADTSYAVVGEEIHYDYLVYNISSISYDNVILTDDLLGRIAVRTRAEESANAAFSTAPRTLAARPTVVPPYGPYNLCLPILGCQADYLVSNPLDPNTDYTVTPIDAANGSVTNVIRVEGYTGANGIGVEAGRLVFTEAEVTVPAGNPLEITKVGPTDADRGDIISFTIIISNTAPIGSHLDITNFTVIDSRTGTVAFPPEALVPGESRTASVEVEIPQTAVDPYTNTVIIDGTLNIPAYNPDGTIVTNPDGSVVFDSTYDLSDRAEAQVNLDDPILDIVLASNYTEGEVGLLVRWDAQITNTSPDTNLINLVYDDSTAIDVMQASIDHGTPCPTELATNESVSCSWEYTIIGTDPDPLENTLNVTAELGSGAETSGSDTFIIDLRDPNFYVAKNANPSIVFAGDTVVYEIEVFNTSGTSMTNISAFDSITGPVPLEFPLGNNAGELQDGESASAQIEYQIDPTDPSPLRNYVTASGITALGNSHTDTTYTDVIITASQLLVEKRATPTIAESGGTIRYDIAMTNIGQTPLTNLQLVDAAVGLDTSVNGTVCGGDFGDYIITCNVNTPLTIAPIDALNPFEVAFISYTIDVVFGIPDPFVNSVIATAVDPDGIDVEGSDTIAVDIITPGISLTKSADRAGAGVGDIVLYTIEVANTSPTVPLNNMQIWDNDLEATPVIVEMSVEGNPVRVTEFSLAPGETAVGIVEYTVTAATPNPFVNTVTAYIDCDGSDPDPEIACTPFDGTGNRLEIRDLGLTVTKTPRQHSVLVGDPIIYDIEVTNSGNQELIAVTAYDQFSTLPIELFDPASPTTPVSSLAPGESAIGEFEYIVQPDDPDPLSNRVTASARTQAGTNISASGYALVDIRTADVRIEKTADPSVALVGDTITYTIEVTNEGASALSDVSVYDPLCASAASGCAGTQVELEYYLPDGSVDSSGMTGTVLPDDPATSAIDPGMARGQVTRTILASDTDPLTNTAIVSATTTNGLTIQDTSSATVQIASSELVVSKEIMGFDDCSSGVPNPGLVAQPGDVVAYRVTIQNLSNDWPIENISVIDMLTGQDLTDGTIYPVPLSPTLNISSLVGSSQSSICFTYLITDAMPSPLVNTVVATGELDTDVGPLPVSDTAFATVTIANSNLVVTNTPTQSSANIGDTVTYLVTIDNIGLEPLSNLTTNVIPANCTQLGLSGGTILNPGHNIQASYTCNITGLVADPFASTVSAAATPASGGSVSHSATAYVDIVSPGLRVTKVALPTSAPVGDDVTYNISITNTGAEDITSIEVIDMMLGGDITGCFDPGVALPDPAPNCTVPTISLMPIVPGETLAASISRTISSDDGDPVINTVSVIAQTATTTLVDTASATVTIPGAGLTVIKQADVVAASVGDTITYTIEVINTSTTPVSGLVLADTLTSSISLPKSWLGIGEHMTVSYTHTVSNTDPNPLENIVFVSGRDSFNVAVNDYSTASVDLLSDPNIRVQLSADKASVLANQTINYLAQITNISATAMTLTDVIVNLPDGTQIIVVDAPTTQLLAKDTLAPGETVTYAYSYLVQMSDTSPLVSTIIATGALASGGTATDTGAASTTRTVSSLDVDLIALDCEDPCVVLPSDIITFQAQIHNDGATPLINVAMTSSLPIVPLTAASGFIVPPGETVNVDFTYTVPLNTANPLIIPVTVTGNDPIGNIIAGTGNFSIIIARPQISIILSADRTDVLDGTAVNYTASITNTGTEALQNIAVLDSVVGSVTGLVPVLQILPGETVAFTYSHLVHAGDNDPLVSTITVSAITEFGRSVTDNDTIRVNVIRPRLLVTLSASPPASMLGQPIQYSATIQNVGDGTITNLRGSYIVSSVATTNVAQHPMLQGGVINIGSTTLPPGAATIGTFSYIPTSNDPNPLVMRATVTGSGITGASTVSVTDDATVITPLITTDANGNPIVVGTPIPGTADPEVLKTTDQTFAVPGGLVTWMVTVRNPGTDPLAGIIITDTLDYRMTLETIAIENGEIQTEGNVIVAVTDTLAFNESTTLTIVSRLNDGIFANAILDNTACATSVGGTASICDTAQVRVSPDVDLLPATGVADAAPSSNTSQAIGLIVSLLVLVGLGFAVQGSTGVLRIVLIIVAIGAVVVVIGIGISALTNNGATPDPTSAPPDPTSEPEIAEAATNPPAAETPAGDEMTSVPAATEDSGEGVEATPALMPTREVVEAPPVIPASDDPAPFVPQFSRELFIPKLALPEGVPIVNIPLRNQTWDVRDLGESIGFLQGTTWIDEAQGTYLGGNTVLAGHIQLNETEPGPFRDLDLLEVGDSIFIAESGTIYEYEIYEIDVVAPDAVEVTYPTGETTLTLLTCTTWNAFRGVFAERLMIRAKPVRLLHY